MENLYLRIIGIEKGDETKLKDPEMVFHKIIEEHFPN